MTHIPCPPLAFYTTFGKRRQSAGRVLWHVEVACVCQALFFYSSASTLSGRYKGTLCASESRIVVMHALAIAAASSAPALARFLVGAAAVMASPQKWGSALARERAKLHKVGQIEPVDSCQEQLILIRDAVRINVQRRGSQCLEGFNRVFLMCENRCVIKMV